MSQGWILLHRQLQDCWIWKDEPFSKGQAWVDLLLLANHKERKILINGELKTIRKGQFHTSVLKLADRWMWSRGKTKRFLEILENDEMIVAEYTKGGTSNGTTITIVNYENFQFSRTTDDTSDDTTDDTTLGQRTIQRSDINKELKRNKKNENNEKNEKNNRTDYFPNDEELNQTFLDYINMRKQIKKPMSSKAITLAMNKLESLSGGDNEKAIKILNQSIFNSWQGLFELKEPKQKEQSSFFEALNKCT